jgi:hypothetical protein
MANRKKCAIKRKLENRRKGANATAEMAAQMWYTKTVGTRSTERVQLSGLQINVANYIGRLVHDRRVAANPRATRKALAIQGSSSTTRMALEDSQDYFGCVSRRRGKANSTFPMQIGGGKIDTKLKTQRDGQLPISVRHHRARERRGRDRGPGYVYIIRVSNEIRTCTIVSNEKENMCGTIDNVTLLGQRLKESL